MTWLVAQIYSLILVLNFTNWCTVLRTPAWRLYVLHILSVDGSNEYRDFPNVLHSVSSLDFGSSWLGFQAVWMPLHPLAHVISRFLSNKTYLVSLLCLFSHNKQNRARNAVWLMFLTIKILCIILQNFMLNDLLKSFSLNVYSETKSGSSAL